MTKIESSFLSLEGGRISHFRIAHYPLTFETIFHFEMTDFMENFKEPHCYYSDDGIIRWYRPIRKELGVPKTYSDHKRFLWTFRALLGVMTCNEKYKEEDYSDLEDGSSSWDSDQWTSDEDEAVPAKCSMNDDVIIANHP